VRLFGTRRALPSTRSLISQFLFIGAARPLHINAVQGLHLALLALADFNKVSRPFIKKVKLLIYFFFADSIRPKMQQFFLII